MRCFFTASDIFRGSSYGKGHPLNIPRVWPVMDLCRGFGWLDDRCYLPVKPATADELSLFHKSDYIAALLEAEHNQDLAPEKRAKFQIGQSGNPIYPEIYSRPATAAKASMVGAKLLATKQADYVFNPSGGTHHGQPGRASGFCFVNDPVLAILTMQKEGVSRIAYIDIDAHHADGVQDALSHDPALRLYSVHEEDRWPRTGMTGDVGAGSARNYVLPRGAGDSDLLHVMQQFILPDIERFQPEILVIQAGSDGLAADPQSGLTYSTDGYWQAVQICLALQLPALILGGGGYNPITTARAWTGIWGLLIGADPHNMMLDAEAGAMLRSLQFPHRLGRNMPERWFTHLGDRMA